MLTQICQYLRNWFERAKHIGEFTIHNNTIVCSNGDTLPLLHNQYYRIIGSVFNDGVHKYEDSTDSLIDETFAGAVWSMAVPPVIEELADEISTWVESNANALNSPFQSESFGGYSYSLRSGTSPTGSMTGVTWQSQFESRLAPWRKI